MRKANFTESNLIKAGYTPTHKALWFERWIMRRGKKTNARYHAKIEDGCLVMHLDIYRFTDLKR